MSTYSGKRGYGFRPKSYWEVKDPLTAILAHVSGQARRKLITDYWDAGELDKLNEELLKDELTDRVRQDLGRIHPFFMGGEYLPGWLPDEVAIVRIGLRSTTYDVIELRARRISQRAISLRWVDEYETTFSQPCDQIDRPFSLGELIDFIQDSEPDGQSWGPLPLCYSKMNNEYLEDPESLRDFTSLGSDFYPGLSAWFSGLVDEWVAELTGGDEEDREA